MCAQYPDYVPASQLMSFCKRLLPLVTPPSSTNQIHPQDTIAAVKEFIQKKVLFDHS
jgi:hypothetical protein